MTESDSMEIMSDERLFHRLIPQTIVVVNEASSMRLTKLEMCCYLLA